MKIIALVISLFVVCASAAQAKDRYSLTKLSDGTVRIDHRTGAISYCREQEGDLVCSLAAEERQAWIKETEDLTNRLNELEKRIAIIEANPPKSETQSKVVNPEKERELDKAIEFMEKSVRRFADVFDELKKEFQKD